MITCPKLCVGNGTRPHIYKRQKARRNAALKAMGRQDVIESERGNLYVIKATRTKKACFNDGSPFKPNELYFCRCHFIENIASPVDHPLELGEDPVILGKAGTKFNEDFITQNGFSATSIGIARKAAIDDQGSATKRQAADRNTRSDLKNLGLLTSPEIGRKEVTQQALRDLAQRVESLDATVMEQSLKILELERLLLKSTPAITYEALIATTNCGLAATSGFSEIESRAFTRLKPHRLVALVKGMEVTNCHFVWMEAVKTISRTKQLVLDFGFRNSVALVFIHMATGTTLRQTAWSCNLGNFNAVGDTFDITIRIINRFYREIFAIPQLLDQLDADQLPAFAPPLLDQFLLTADASNIQFDFKPLTPEGASASYSPYYDGNCAKFELVTYTDGRVAWVSLACGGASSEEKIVHKVEDDGEGCPQIGFTVFYDQFSKGCVDEEGNHFKPGLIADKGSHLSATMDTLGAKYLTPSSTAGDSILSYHDIINNEIISKARGHIERAIEKMKRFRILKTGIHHRQVHNIDEITFFAAFSTHLLD